MVTTASDAGASWAMFNPREVLVIQRAIHLLTFMFVLTFGSTPGCSSTCGGADQVPTTSSEADTQTVTPSTVHRFEVRFVSLDEQEGVPVKTWHDGRTLRLEPEAIIDTDDVVDVREEVGSDGREALIIGLDESSAARFAEITERNIGRQAALVVGGKVVHTPTIREAISGGSIRVSKCSGLEISQMLSIIRDGQLSEPL